ncbi:hypothetical protein, partial [Pseudoalteromonas sp.]|uniref:hypothetical protein n=1 Tax=Pseudoalteromonas sp. TaxID=53249 RepID=UPI002621B8C1
TFAVQSDGLEHFCTLKECLHASKHFAVHKRRKFPSFQHMLTLLAVSLIAQAHIFDTTSWIGTLICAQSLLTCMSKKTIQPYSALALLFSTELGISKLKKLIVSIRLRSLITRWKATP